MNVLVAGGSGAIGVPLVRQLVAAGHQVTALTRSSANAAMLKRLGATPAVADALDADALRHVVVAAHPTHVIHQLTALPKAGPKSARDLISTNRLRIDGTRHLIAAAMAAGAQRLVGGSFALMGASTFGVPPMHKTPRTPCARWRRRSSAPADRKVNGEPAVVVRVAGRIDSVYVPTVDGDAITALRIVRNPDKLTYIGRQLTEH
jgi:nucleoside-diphosphate-sugar epimerase